MGTTVLRELRLNNLAIAKDVRLELDPGLNVLTGSTGAGKSLVVEALRWLTGEPIERGWIRSGADAASAEAFFDLSDRAELLAAVEDLGVPRPRDGCLRLRREVKVAGRSRAFVDATPASAAMLASICGRLIELQSQHEQSRLLSGAAHASLLDGCGVREAALLEFENSFQAHAAAFNAAADWKARRAELLAQRDLLHYQLRELSDAALTAGEMDTLRQSVARMSGGARLLQAVAAAHGCLQDEERGAAPALSEAHRLLGRVGSGIEELERAGEALSAAAELTEEAARSLARLLDAAEVDPAELDRAQARLAQLEALGRKYGRTEVELVQLRDRLARDLEGIDAGEALPESIDAPLRAAVQQLQNSAQALNRERRTVARRAEKAAATLLAELGMPQAEMRFELLLREDAQGPVRIEATPVAPTRDGAERVRLLVRTNRGEPLGPVERVASGGELSRLALVLRTLSAARRQPALVILDEVDTGLSADLGPALASRLRAMSANVQLLVITHLPAVAAAGDRHLAASKEQHGSRVVSEVTRLSGEARVAEIARMLGGDGDVQRRHARHLLRAGRGGEREEASA